MRPLYAYCIAVIILASCSSGQTLFIQGNYYESVITSVNKLRRDPGHEKSISTLRQAYPLTINYYEEQIHNSMASTVQFKWYNTIQSYTTLQSMYDEIKRCPGCLQVIPSPTNYSEKLREARNNAAEEYYAAGVTELSYGSRDHAKKAYTHFLKCSEIVPGYKNVDQKIDEAKWASTLKIMVEYTASTKKYGVSSEAFDKKVFESIQSSFNDPLVKVMSEHEFKTRNLKPDQIIKIQLDQFDLGKASVQQSQSVAKKDSIAVAGDYVAFATPAGAAAAEKARLEKEAKDKADKEKLDKEAKDKADKEKVEKEKIDKEKADKEAKDKADKEKLEKEKADKDKADKANADKEAKDKAEKDRVEKEKTEKEAKDKADKEKADKDAKDKADKEKVEKEKADKEKADKDKADKDAKDKADKEKVEKEKADKEKADKEKADKEAKDKADKEKVEKEKADKEKADKEKAEKEEKDKAEKEKVEKEKADKEKAEKEKEDKEKKEAKEKEEDKKDAKEKEDKDKSDSDKKSDDDKDEKKDGDGKNGGGTSFLILKDPVYYASARKGIIYAEEIEADTSKQYHPVKATYTLFKKTRVSKSVFTLTVLDAKTNAVLLTEKMEGTFNWESQWATMKGDTRALSPSQLELTKLKEQNPPNPQDSFTESIKPVEEKIKSRLQTFYQNQ